MSNASVDKNVVIDSMTKTKTYLKNTERDRAPFEGLGRMNSIDTNNSVTMTNESSKLSNIKSAVLGSYVK